MASLPIQELEVTPPAEIITITPREPSPLTGVTRNDYDAVTQTMLADDYYRTHTTSECLVEWRRRHDAMMANRKPG